MQVAGVRPGEEVLMPALPFVATANAADPLGAVPHFVDSAAETLGIDPVALAKRLRRIGQPSPDGLVNRETGRRISCVVPMHVFGHPVELDELAAVAAALRLLFF